MSTPEHRKAHDVLMELLMQAVDPTKIDHIIFISIDHEGRPVISSTLAGSALISKALRSLGNAESFIINEVEMKIGAKS